MRASAHPLRSAAATDMRAGCPLLYARLMRHAALMARALLAVAVRTLCAATEVH